MMDQFTGLFEFATNEFGIFYDAIRGIRGKKEDMEMVVIKKMPINDNVVSTSMLREASLLQDISNPNIIRLLKPIFVEDGYLVLVFERIPMNLQEHMCSPCKKDSEAAKAAKDPIMIKKFLKQILGAVAFCHSHGIIHRNINMESLLVDISIYPPIIKLSNFGLARGFVTTRTLLTPEVVTLKYRAPELLLGAENYSIAVDMWSIGCVFSEMLSVKYMFDGETRMDVLTEIFSIMGTPNEETWPGVTSLPKYPTHFPIFPSQNIGTLFPTLEPAGVNLLSRLLFLNPAGRITVEDALNHEYFG